MAVLAGTRVIELATGLAGPYAGQLIRAYGADVTKVERPGGGDFARTWGPLVEGNSLYFAAVNRGKRSVGIDLKASKGRDIVLRLVEATDVLIENFRPGTLEGWGLGPDVLHAHNPDLVICRISGFGQSGPYSGRPAFDPIVQALSGFMSVNGETEGEPVRSPLPLSDVLTGIHAALAITAALHEPKPRSNNLIDLALLDVMVSSLLPQNLFHLGTDQAIERMGNRHPALAPYEVFEALDRPLCVAVANQGQWQRFCSAMGLGQLLEDPLFATNAERLQNRAQLRAVLEEAFRLRPAAEWMEVLEAGSVPCAPINTVADVYADPHVQGREFTASVSFPRLGRSLQMPTLPPQNWNAFGVNSLPPPALGADTLEVLAEIGIAAAEAQRLRAEDIVE